MLLLCFEGQYFCFNNYFAYLVLKKQRLHQLACSCQTSINQIQKPLKTNIKSIVLAFTPFSMSAWLSPKKMTSLWKHNTVSDKDYNLISTESSWSKQIPVSLDYSTNATYYPLSKGPVIVRRLLNQPKPRELQMQALHAAGQFIQKKIICQGSKKNQTKTKKPEVLTKKLSGLTSYKPIAIVYLTGTSGSWQRQKNVEYSSKWKFFGSTKAIMACGQIRWNL